jgi:hypothetical protein
MENEESPDGILNNNAFSKKENDEIIEASVITSVSTSGSLLTNDSFAEIDGIYNSSLSKFWVNFKRFYCKLCHKSYILFSYDMIIIQVFLYFLTTTKAMEIFP